MTPNPFNQQDFTYMRLALEMAAQAAHTGEVPIGAVLVRDNQIISTKYNEIELQSCPTAHAEMLVIREAAKKLNNWRLNSSTLYVTLEPCAMCWGAIRLARISRIVYGASDSRFGALSQALDPKSDKNIGPVPEICSQLMAEDSLALLKSFFSKLRAK